MAQLLGQVALLLCDVAMSGWQRTAGFAQMGPAELDHGELVDLHESVSPIFLLFALGRGPGGPEPESASP